MAATLIERSCSRRRSLTPGPYVEPMVRAREARQVVRSAAAAAALLMLVTACGSTSSDGRGSTSTAPGASASSTSSAPPASATTADAYPTGSQTVSWDVDGVTRTAQLVVPADLAGPVPLV